MRLVLNKNTIDGFITNFVNDLKLSKNQIVRPIGKSWDADVRPRFAEVFCTYICKKLDLHTREEVKQFLFVEKWNPIPTYFRGMKFLESKIYPDAAIITPELKCAIELDHGFKGSQVRNALSKTGFSYLLGGFDCAFLLFFLTQSKHPLLLMIFNLMIKY